MQSLKKHFLWLGPLISSIIALILSLNGLSNTIIIVVAVTSLCALWWIFEPIPIPITSLLPLALFSLTGVLTSSQVAEAYGHPLILLLLGGFILSQSMAYSGAHRRIALLMVNLFGANSGRSLVLGFMVAAALLSMWVSNTATTLMLLPVALATLEDNKDPKLTIALLLGIAYAANIGGIGTPIGTPPNALFMSGYSEATGISLGFLDWMKWGVPVVILFIPCAMLWITKDLKQQISIKLPSVGQWTTPEVRVLLVFAVTAVLWITRKQPYGGWSELTGLTNANDASVALLACIALFIIPSGASENNEIKSFDDAKQPSSDNTSGRLLNWHTAKQIPWGVLLLFAGGICIAKAFGASGLSKIIGDYLSELALLTPILLIALIALAVTFLTEMTSNTATTALLMPILAAAALSAKIDPALLMIPAAMSASCAFMLPVATAPNAIVYGTDKIAIQTMVKTGFALNLIGVAIVTLVVYLLVGV